MRRTRRPCIVFVARPQEITAPNHMNGTVRDADLPTIAPAICPRSMTFGISASALWRNSRCQCRERQTIIRRNCGRLALSKRSVNHDAGRAGAVEAGQKDRRCGGRAATTHGPGRARRVAAARRVLPRARDARGRAGDPAPARRRTGRGVGGGDAVGSAGSRHAGCHGSMRCSQPSQSGSARQRR